MRTRFALVAGAALLASGLGFASAAQKAAAVSMIVYKSQT